MNIMKHNPLRAAIPAILVLFIAACKGSSDEQLPLVGSFVEEEFSNPPMKYRPAPLWFWNNAEVSIDGVTAQLHQMVETDGYGGCAIVPFGPNFGPDYLGEDYMKIYTQVVNVADTLGAHMSLYDEYGFPSGSMGFSNADGVPRFMIAHPDRTIKRLDKHETPVDCGTTVEIDLASLEGKLMAVAAYDSISHRSESLRGFIDHDRLTWTAPAQGGWKVMVFECVIDGKPREDYLDPKAAEVFIQDVHEKYFSRVGDRFGSVITSTFFDEPTMYYAEGRMWTNTYNDRFVERYGMEPDALYPALWYDIGEQTAAARNLLYGLHSAMYTEGFMKPVAEWAEAHGIISTGHQDQEELANTTGASGDLMLDCKYMTMPGIDKIGGDRPAELFYKVISSAANNWDKTEVMSETFGAMGDIPLEEMYSIAIEQHSKGITNLIPHAVWYDDSQVTFPPELSWRNPLYNTELPEFNRFLSRLRYVLSRPGRHVADIAMLYPVQTQYAGHYFDGPLGPVSGSVAIEANDYPEVSRILTDELGRDFTYIHPEILDQGCAVEGGKLRMANKINSEEFSAIILPSVKAISLSNMQQIQKAWEDGVKIIFTTQTPSQSADYSVANSAVTEIVEHMLTSSDSRRSALFVPDPSPESLADALGGIDADVRFLSPGEPFNYLHKVMNTDEGVANIFFIGNIDSSARRQEINLRGKYSSVRIIDPHSGTIAPASTKVSGGRTTLSLELGPARSVIILAQ